MPEIIKLTEFLASIEAEKAELDTIDIDALVNARLEEIKAQIFEEITGDIEDKKFVADIKIATIKQAIDVVSQTLQEPVVATADFSAGDTYEGE